MRSNENVHKIMINQRFENLAVVKSTTRPSKNFMFDFFSQKISSNKASGDKTLQKQIKIIS